MNFQGKRTAISLSVSSITLLTIVASTSLSQAEENDLVLSRLATRVTDGGGRLMSVVPQNLEFRALASQLGVVLAPRMMTPADTLGFGGFQLSVDTSSTAIDSGAAYWRARAGSPDAAGAGGVAHGPGQLSTTGFYVRKGMWFPLPSFELGAGAVLLNGSRTWAAQFSAKFAIHEGYHDLPIPSVAIRGSVSRMMNQRELDLTIPSVDVVVSKHVGVAGTWSVDPFAGYNLLMIVPRSEVIDPTPGIDPLKMGSQSDIALNFVFRDQALILRHRLSAGAKFKYSIAALTVEAQYGFAGSSVDDQSQTSALCELNSMTTACDAKDLSKAQTSLSVAAALDF
jgi:hypothetical protein